MSGSGHIAAAFCHHNVTLQKEVSSFLKSRFDKLESAGVRSFCVFGNTPSPMKRQENLKRKTAREKAEFALREELHNTSTEYNQAIVTRLQKQMRL